MKKTVLAILGLVLACACAWGQAFTIHLMGDSTMAPKDLSKGSPERGWGMMLPNFLDNGVSVVNWAQNGRSTKDFQTKGIWDKVKASVKPGDYVFIQFGHNDGKQGDSTRFTEPYGDYQKNLRMYCSTVRELGATPVLLTPVARRWFKSSGLDRNCHGEYPAAMKQVAEEMGVTLLDITTPTLDWLEALGDEASRPYFMYDWNPEKTDNTHTRPAGARKVASIVCDAIRTQLPQIAEHLTYWDAVVAKDGTGDYFTVQEAINAAPDYCHAKITRILIKAGTYKEMVTIPHNKFRLYIKGEDAGKTIITYDKYAEKLWPDGSKTGTSGSASMYIHSSYVTMEDLTVENSSGEGKPIGQAVALFTDGDFLFFNRCRFIGNQDTVYTYGRYGKDGGIKRNYFLNCYIEGTTDFIFGPSIAYFEGCTIHSKKNSYVTAASTLPGQKYGYVFRNCTLTAADGIEKCYLGRPWGAYAKTVFIDCTLGAHILPAGWHDWEKEGKPNTKENSFYAEYGSKGPGAKGKRVDWSHKLSRKDLEEYDFQKVMYQEQDGIKWDPYNNK